MADVEGVNEVRDGLPAADPDHGPLHPADSGGQRAKRWIGHWAARLEVSDGCLARRGRGRGVGGGDYGNGRGLTRRRGSDRRRLARAPPGTGIEGRAGPSTTGEEQTQSPVGQGQGTAASDPRTGGDSPMSGNTTSRRTWPSPAWTPAPTALDGTMAARDVPWASCWANPGTERQTRDHHRAATQLPAVRTDLPPVSPQHQRGISSPPCRPAVR